MSASAGYLLYLVFALGGAGLYLLLPRGGRSRATGGAVLGLLALAGLVVVWAGRMLSPVSPGGFFYPFAILAVLAAARVVTHSRPVYSAIYFVLLVVAVAALLVLQEAEFLAVALVIIYAGAIIVTYLFVIMLAQQEEMPIYDSRAREPFLAVLAGFVLMAAVAGRAGDLGVESERGLVSTRLVADRGARDSIPAGNTAAVAAALMTRYVVVLEIAGVLLVVSMVGAVAMSRKKFPAEQSRSAVPSIGQIGKEVPPY